MSSSPTDVLVDVTMPQMGVSVAEGTVVAWRVEPGDRIEAEATICEISTDKIDTEVPAPATGVVTEILVPIGETVEVGTVMARIATGAGAPRPAARWRHGRRTDHRAVIPHPTPAAGRHQRQSALLARRPADRRRARDRPQSGAGHRAGRSRAQAGRAGVRRSGPGRGAAAPHREPVPARAGGGAPAAAVAADGELSRMRRQIGEHMKRSLETAATCTTWIEVDMSRVEAARARLGVTALAFVARASIDAIREHPAMNAWLEGEKYTRHSDVNLGIAVSLGDEGLIVPVVPRAHELSVEGLAARIREIARRARSRQLTPDDVYGGTFTITNPGQYGSIMATPIINQPQVAILDFEAVIKRAVVVTDADGNDSIAIRPMTILGLSWDHRALDGAVAAQFLATVKRHLESVAP